MKTIAAGLAAALLFAGCTQTLPIKGNGAQMDIRLSSDSTGTMMETWAVHKYHDPLCEKEEKGVVLSKTMLGKGAKSLDPIRLPTDDKLTLSFFYLDARFGVNLQCGYTVTFVPVENQHYTARFAVVGNASFCSVEITNAAGQPVNVTTPEYACHAGAVPERVPNGGRGVKRAPRVTVYSR